MQSIAITRDGTSGDMFRKLAKKLGVWTEITATVCQMEPGDPIRALVAGEVEMVAQPLTNIVTIEGIVPVAICPEDLNVHIDLSFCINPLATGPTHDLASWLSAPERDVSLEASG